MKNAYFAGGCFWCITPVFDRLEGILSVTSGYCGGDEADPTYEQVKHQQTHHRETIRIAYDEEILSYEKLLQVFLANVDPFDGGGQFIDRGLSYTLAVYYADPQEEQAARAGIAALAQKSGQEVCVAVEPLKTFYDAEEYHQDYYRKNPEAFEKELEESGRKAHFGA